MMRTSGEDSLLELISTVTVPKTKKLVARDSFTINTESAAPVKISYLCDDFCRWFLKKTEAPFDEVVLRCNILRRASIDRLIFAELGKDKAEITLAQIYALMRGQKNGDDGILLNNGRANIFYVRDVNSVLRTVFVYWRSGAGWRVNADLVDGLCKWDDGCRVFSRNS